MSNARGDSARCDLLIEGGDVVDGSGAPRRRADVAVSGDRILAVGDLHGIEASARVDARGLTITPGFIDAHTHDDRALLSSPQMTPKVSQGVTTVVTGNCGVSLAPLTGIDPPPPLNLLGGRDWYRYATTQAYVDDLNAHPPALNVAMLVGHSTLRAGVMDRLDRAADEHDIARMGELLDAALDAGCIGMSTGLAYPPAAAAPTDEIVALAEHLARRGAIYTTHMRDERAGVVDSVEETLEIGRRARVPVVISHHKCSGRENWGLTRTTLAVIEDARRRQQVDLDVYPYTASSTVLLADWVPSAECVRITWSTPHPECAGRDLAEIQAEWGCGMEEAVARLEPAGAIYHQMDEADLRRVIAFADAMIGSDGLPHDEAPHPRLWGTFPRVLGHYCREEGLLGFEEGVRRMTSVPARVFGLADRGEIRDGGYADLVLLDAERVIDRASYDTPAVPAAGIIEVMVNGQSVWRRDAPSGNRPGRVLRRSADDD